MYRHRHWKMVAAIISAFTIMNAEAAGNGGVIASITDLPIFTQLAPCAQRAVSAEYESVTRPNACGPAASTLQSCVCSNSRRLSTLTSGISRNLKMYCGTAIADDLSSALKLVQKYCTPDATVNFPTPTTNIVTQSLISLPEITNVATCVKYALSQVIDSAGYLGCPTVDNMYAPCVCTKSTVVSKISQILPDKIMYWCSNTEDLVYAANFYTDYCNLNKGISTFALPRGAPGDVSYYITAMPQYKSLKTCAQSAVYKAAMGQSERLCPPGPRALASCACLKPGISKLATSVISTYVDMLCGTTAYEDMTSAMLMFGQYCSAAENKLVVTVAQSIKEQYTMGALPSLPPAMSFPTQTGQTTTNDNPIETSSSNESSNRNAMPSWLIAIIVIVCLIPICAVTCLCMLLRRLFRSKRVLGNREELNPPPYWQPNDPNIRHQSELEQPTGNEADGRQLPGRIVPSHYYEVSDVNSQGRRPVTELQGLIPTPNELPGDQKH